MKNAMAGAGVDRRPDLSEQAVPLQRAQSEDKTRALAAAEGLAAADAEAATSVPDVDPDPLSADVVPLRDICERREAEEREARLRLLLPRSRFRH